MCLKSLIFGEKFWYCYASVREDVFIVEYVTYISVYYICE